MKKQGDEKSKKGDHDRISERIIHEARLYLGEMVEVT